MAEAQPDKNLPSPDRTAPWLALALGLALVLLLGMGINLLRQHLPGAGADVAGTAPEVQVELDQLRERTESLERELQIEQEAHRLAQQELQHIQAHSANMEQELARLRPLVNAEAKRALRIEEFKLLAGTQEHQFKYKLKVVRADNGPGFMTGIARVSVHGTQGPTPRRFSLRELSPEHVEEHPLKFQKFQDLEGRLTLPEGFVPDSLTLELRPAAKGAAPLTELFDWVVGG